MTQFVQGMRVYWEDTDAGGVVFYANYLKFFERARTEWLRHLGFSQEAMRVEQGLMFVVSATSLKYLAPAKLDDWLDVSVNLQGTGRSTMVLFQQVHAGGRLLCEGEIRIACVDAQSFKPTRIAAPIAQKLAQKLAPLVHAAASPHSDSH
ncbi:MAG: tol-pal system-associated acyl-CoA thioesterase [Pelomonas sp.]|nr:tol-pal system-associated acyl-CoA thioesterase [Burkholderiaceae bacterium]MBV8604601.1 tol-pal system-associated acyl-CoA thioesterase [Roseateles sp.]